MLLAPSITRRLAGDHTARRRRREFTPSINESASRLEDRALLSAAGGSAPAAAATHNLANTPAGQRVTAMFESILHIAPTSQQVTQWVNKIHAGTSIKVLQRQLTADARTQAGMQASVVTVSSSSAHSTRNASSAATLPAGLRSSVGGSANRNSVRQVPFGVAFTGSSTGLVSHTVSFTTGTAGPARTTRTTGTTTTTTSTTTSSSTIGTPTPLTFTPLTFTPLTVPTSSPANSSPLPVNGTLPFTGTPANPSPLPSTGTLPFTGTPANPSPVPVNGTLPFTGTPANPSPVPVNGTLPFTGTPANPSPMPSTGTLF